MTESTGMEQGLRAGIYLGLGGFAMLMILATRAYPGGTFSDRHAPGYDIWRNFWSDLLRDPALNGEPNRTGSLLAQIAFVCLAVTLVGFWLLPWQKLGSQAMLPRVMAAVGVVGSLGLALVAALPSDRFPKLHTWSIVIAAPLGMLAVALLIMLQIRHLSFGDSDVSSFARVRTLLPWLGGSAVLCAIINLVQYVREAWLGALPLAYLPALQKTASLFFLLWVALGTLASKFTGAR